MTDLPADLDFGAIRLRDARSGELWFTGPESFTALAARDRRALIAEIEQLRTKVQNLLDAVESKQAKIDALEHEAHQLRLDLAQQTANTKTVLDLQAENARMRVAICGYVNAKLAGRGSAASYWFDLQDIAKALPAEMAGRCRHGEDIITCRLCIEDDHDIKACGPDDVPGDRK